MELERSVHVLQSAASSRPTKAAAAVQLQTESRESCCFLLGRKATSLNWHQNTWVLNMRVTEGMVHHRSVRAGTDGQDT